MVRIIARKRGLPEDVVTAIIMDFIDITKSSVKSGDPVYIRKFGTFAVKSRKAKTVRDIGRNITMISPEHDVVTFKPSSDFVL